MSVKPVLINGEWRTSAGSKTFHAVNPATKEKLPEEFPVSPWNEVEQAIQSAANAADIVREWPGSRFAAFLRKYADLIEAKTDALVKAAHTETALPVSPRLKDGELPRTTGQLRQAASAAESEAWREPTIDTATGIRSMYGPLGPVVVFGPNNFPFAFNGISGGDFAAAVAAGNPVIGKGHSSHPETSRLFGEAAHQAAQETAMPPGFVQLIYRTSHEDGAKLVSHPLMGGCGYTGGRPAGLVIKEAADKAGKPVYLELSSINPVCILPGALEERLDDVAGEFTASCLMGTGQFCTNPGIVLLLAGPTTDQLIETVKGKFESVPVGTLLSGGVQKGLTEGIIALQAAGADVITGGEAGGGDGFCVKNTLLKVSATDFLANPEKLQTEAFGNSSLFVIADSPDEMKQVVRTFEGNLTGCIYSSKEGSDDSLYDQVAPLLRQKVGRLLNDKMPTGVAVSPAMNHGGPYPATGHPGFTSVGIPASIKRFAMLQCFDNVRPHRLPPVLQDQNPIVNCWRYIDGEWTTKSVGG
jgi:NADP-dependent aldehyde dehydrogenase